MMVTIVTSQYNSYFESFGHLSISKIERQESEYF